VEAERLAVLGWWHTHPNSLDVFLSSTDMETIRLKYYKPEKYSMVLNPHRGIFRAFAGGGDVEVPVVMLLDGNQVPTPRDNRKKRPKRTPRIRKTRRMKINKRRK
jgi:hypothetical protein